MKLVPALLIAALMTATASASDQFVPIPVSGQYLPPPGAVVLLDTQFPAQTVGYSLHSDECGCGTCAPGCAAPAPCYDICVPSCAAPAPCCDSCAPDCAAPAPCCDSCGLGCAAPCDPCHACCDCPPVCCEPPQKGFFSRMMDIERRKNNWLLGLIGR